MNFTPKSRKSTVKHEVKSRFWRFANNFCRKNIGFSVDFHFFDNKKDEKTRLFYRFRRQNLCKPPHGSRTQKFEATDRCYTLTLTIGVKPLKCQGLNATAKTLRRYVTYYVTTLPTTLLRYLLRYYATYYVTTLPPTLLRYPYYVTTLPTTLLHYLLRYYAAYYFITLPTTLLHYLLRYYANHYVTGLPPTLLRYQLRYYATYYVTTLPTT